MQICSVPAVIKMQDYLWQIRSEDYFSVRMSTEVHTSVNKPVFPPGSKNTEIFYYPTISPALRCHGQAQKQYSCLSTSALSFLSPSNVNFHSIRLTAFFYFILHVWVFYWHAYLCPMCMPAAHTSQKRALDPLNWSCEKQCECWELNSGPSPIESSTRPNCPLFPHPA